MEDSIKSASATPSSNETKTLGLTKAPNILIYTGRELSTAFDTLKEDLIGCLGVNSHTIYHLEHGDIVKVPWQQNCRLVIVTSDKLYDGVDVEFSKYLMSGGNVLSICSDLDSHFQGRTEREDCNGMGMVVISSADNLVLGGKELGLIAGSYYYSGDGLKTNVPTSTLAVDAEKRSVMTACRFPSGGHAIFAQVHLEQSITLPSVTEELCDQLHKMPDNEPRRHYLLKSLLNWLRIEGHSDKEQLIKPTHCYLLCTDEEKRNLFISEIKKKHFSKVKDNILSLPDLCDIDLSARSTTFNWQEYCGNLTSKYIGNLVMYQEIARTTQTLPRPFMDILPEDCGLVAIAERQLKGVGRGKNSWLSPAGSLALTMHIQVDVASNLGQAQPIIQTLPALAVAICMDKYLHSSHENISQDAAAAESHLIKVKWPNDIYYKQVKIGGVLVNAEFQTKVHALVGIGVNVCNEKPTSNLNDAIQEWNKMKGKNIPPITISYVLARICSEMEFLIELINSDRTGYMNIYYKYWMHSGQRVDVPHEDIKDALILGLDKHGYLLLEKEDGTQFSVQPDGNSFDMMHNLIRLK